MKVFFTPAIDGTYRVDLQKRLEDQPDAVAYATVQKMVGDYGVNRLDEIGSVKVPTTLPNGKVTGYFTYQQDDL